MNGIEIQSRASSGFVMVEASETKIRYRYERHWKWALGLAVIVVFRVAQTFATSDVRADVAPVLQNGPCEIVEVIDGVTLLVRQTENSRSIKVRLMAVEVPTHRGDAKFVSAQATKFTKSFLNNRTTRIHLDRRRADRDGTGLVFLFADEDCLNVELARSGWTLVKIYPGDAKLYQKQLREAEQSARHSDLGVWAD